MVGNWERVEEVFAGAKELPREKREAFVRERCGEDEATRREVMELLEHDDSNGGFLEGSPLAALQEPGARLGPGTMVGRFRIVELIGSGGMGEVYKALDTRLNRTVAVKVCQERFSKRFEREARAIAALSHRNICTLYDVGPDYLVMEYLEGEPMQGPMTVAKALAYGAQAADALHTAHSKGVVHRDFKPANVMITKAGVKLLDFGLAKVLTGMDNTTLGGDMDARGRPIAGTLRYMAPELLEGKGADARSDIYALGLVLYEALTGKAGYGTGSPGEVAAAILSKDLPALSQAAPGVPAALERVVHKCLAKDPEARWQSALDLRDELLWLAETGAKGPGRRRWGRIGAGMAVAAALLLGVWMGGMARGEREDWTATRLAGPARAAHPKESPDGQLVALVLLQGMQTQVGVMRPDGSSWTVLTGQREQGRTNHVAWATDGTRIYYSRHSGRPEGVYSVPALGGEPSLIVAEAEGGVPVADRSLVVSRVEGRKRRLHRYWLETGKLEALPAYLEPGAEFAVAPVGGGTAIAFFGTADGAAGLLVLDLESGKVRQAGKGRQLRGPVAATRDGKWLLAVGRTGDLRAVVRVPAEGDGEGEVLFPVPGEDEIRTLEPGRDGEVLVDLVRGAEVRLRIGLDGKMAEPEGLPDGGTGGYGWLPDGRSIRAATVEGKRKLLAVRESGETRPLVETGEETAAPVAVSASGDVVCRIGSEGKRELVKASGRDGRILERLRVPAEGITALAMGGGDGVLYYAAEGTIWRMARGGTGGRPERITEGLDVAADPEGRNLYVRKEGKGGAALARVPVEGGAEEWIALPAGMRWTERPMAPQAVDRRGRVLFGAGTADSHAVGAALYDPGRRTVERLRVPFRGEVTMPAWEGEGVIGAVGRQYLESIWRYRRGR
jgi:predicted Ser/Thr protein kinase